MEFLTSSVVSEAMDRNCLVSGNPIQTFATNCTCLAERAVVKALILLRSEHIERCNYIMAMEMHMY